MFQVNTEADGNRDNTGFRVIERRSAFANLVNLKVAANYVDTHYLVKQPGSMVSRVYSWVQQYSLVDDFVYLIELTVSVSSFALQE